MASGIPQDDPNADRESQKYEKPVHGREAILEHLKKRGAPATHQKLCEEFDLDDEDRIEGLRRRLIAMARDGQLICNRRGAYLPISEADLTRGHVQGHRDGFGFVVPEGGGDDLFLNARQMRQVFHGDRVLVREDQRDARGKREAVIVEVLERNTTQVVGRMQREDGVSMVIPENSRINQEILVPEEACQGAGHGQYVTVTIEKQPTVRNKPVGRVVEILGDHMAPGMEITVAIRSYGLPDQWPPAVTEQARSIPDEVSEEAKQGRVDLRDMPLVTIDDESARDFDDAVYAEKRRGGGYRLIVAIADVAWYVRPETALDLEAQNRGNSVYFPDHVVPMLPEKLSNGLCSLNPGVDRLCMVADMNLSREGKITQYCFYEAVMHSHARLTYNKVSAILEHPESNDGQKLRDEYSQVVPHLETLYGCYQMLREAREQRGAIDFETTDTQIRFDRDRKISEIVPVERNAAHKVIEECMLCANVATARFLKQHRIPTLFRVHDSPSQERLADVRQFLSGLGLDLPGGDDPEPQDYQQVLSQVQNRPDAHIIQTVMLRSMKQAVYTSEQRGHFGLGFEEYTHFTSPIRRYPDLLIHRGIKSVIHRKARGGAMAGIKALFGSQKAKTVVPAEKPDPELAQYGYSQERVQQLGEHCSMTERRADDATRDVEAWLKCEFLQGNVGEVFDGVIASVTGFGLFVQLGGVYTEGLVHISALGGDFFHFDRIRHTLIGEHTGRTFRLGDQVRVRVVRVDLDDRKIDLELEESLPDAKKGGGKGSGNRRKGGGKGQQGGGKQQGGDQKKKQTKEADSGDEAAPKKKSGGRRRRRGGRGGGGKSEG
ncbi:MULTISPECIES: ribonuclease R [Halomonadaceae]|uniref:Ribonuclease R n=1 Tax=Vreelandella halophila TaxID=86177 RepID=A0A9X4YCC4_9GAMM|nr:MULTISPECIES: ribonuclease R [Halomonas]MYL26610.1 ribonuclease R [Halomonas utahensis]MYL73947.1 ribonuclease R [Halomonas sp. 22501_18_FS]